MILRFAKTAKELKAAVNADSPQLLSRLYPQQADRIFAALNVLKSARTLSDVMSFRMFCPHALRGDKKALFSMSVGDRKRLILRTLDQHGVPTKSVDFSSEHGLIVEVSEHYGD